MTPTNQRDEHHERDEHDERDERDERDQRRRYRGADPAERIALTPAGDLGLRGRGLTPREQAEVFDSLFFEGHRWRPFVARYAVLMVLSTTIAALGMLADSSAVVIGAMLVAPLMTPLLATAAALVQSWVARLFQSLAVVAAGSVGAMATGWLVAWLTPADPSSVVQLPGELTARTNPSLVDLAIAVAAGAAGGYVMLRKEASSALPGVGISVALVPPLAAVGVLVQLGDADLARRALLLFATNLAAIVLSAAIVFLLAGFVPRHVFRARSRQVTLGLVAAGLLVVLVAVPLAFHTSQLVEDDTLRSQVVELVPDWDETVEITTLDAQVVDGRAEVDLEVSGPASPPPAWRLADLLHRRRGGRIDVSVSFVQQVEDEATAT